MPERRTQEERSRETINRLREAVLQVIAERGYADASTTEIAKSAGVSRGALLHHFPRRIDLIADAADHFWGKASENLSRIADALADEQMDVAGFVDDMWQTVFRPEAARMTIDLVSASQVDAELRARIETSVDKLFEEYDRIATEAFRHPRVNVGTRQSLALVHVATCALRGLRMQEMMKPDPQLAQSVRETLVDLLETHLATSARAGEPRLKEVAQ